MAGKLFPETYIGDSEDVFKKSGKKYVTPQREAKPESPPNMDNESHESYNLVDSGELKELALESKGHRDREVCGSKEDESKPAPSSFAKGESTAHQRRQKPQFANLLDFGWLREKEEEDMHRDDMGGTAEDGGSPGMAPKNPAHDPPPLGGNTEQHLESRASEVSLIDSYLCDEDTSLTQLSASTGYYPCYRTYDVFPRYQPSGGEDHVSGQAEKRPSSPQDGCTQHETLIKHPTQKRGAEANNNSKGVKPSVAPIHLVGGQPSGGLRPVSGGRKLESLGGRREKQVGDRSQDAGKPRTPGSSAGKPSAKVGAAKEPPVAGLGSGQPPAATKSAQKRKPRSCHPEGKDQGQLTEPEPLRLDRRALPPTPEESARPLEGTEGAGSKSEAWPLKERGEECCPEAEATPSRLSFHSIVSWMRKIFRKPPPRQPQPSTSQGAEAGRRPLASWLRLWLARHSNRIYPQTP